MYDTPSIFKNLIFCINKHTRQNEGKNDRDYKGVCLCPPFVLHIYDIIYCLFGSDCGRMYDGCCEWPFADAHIDLRLGEEISP